MLNYNPREVELALLAAGEDWPFPQASDRSAWEAVETSIADYVLEAAEEAAAAPIPPLPATLYLEFKRVGTREGYESAANERRRRLALLAVAECLEGRGRFLDPLLDLAWAICEESSWCWPAHQVELAEPGRPVIDLSAAMTALSLAEMVALLGDRLAPVVGRRIRYEAARRCFDPYLSRHDHWWLFSAGGRQLNNWTAVCNAGVVGAAIYLEQDPGRLAEMIARAARSLQDYLATFDPDGGSSEGPGYWSYGFGYYTLLADLVERRTGGRVSFFEAPGIGEIARYPLRVTLSPGNYANFSDCDRYQRLVPAHLAYLARRLQVPELMSLAQLERELGGQLGPRHELPWLLRSIWWAPDEGLHPALRLSKHDWFRGMHWMIARFDPSDPEALVLAAKGGHNGEMHNQNDVGTFIVQLAGESLVADIGRGRYTRDYFGPRRYEHLANSSLGHSVPVVNGHPQLAGREHGAELLEHVASEGVDLLRLELRAAYPEECGLEALTRTIALHRQAPRGWVELRDEATFARSPGSVESVLITLGECALEAEGRVVIRGSRGSLRVEYDPDRLRAEVQLLPWVDLAEGPRDVRRLVFASKAQATRHDIQLRIYPAQR